MWGFYKDDEASWKHFQRNWEFIKLIWGFYKDNEVFWRTLQRNGGFYEDFNSFLRLFQWNWGFLNKFPSQIFGMVLHCFSTSKMWLFCIFEGSIWPHESCNLKTMLNSWKCQPWMTYRSRNGTGNMHLLPFCHLFSFVLFLIWKSWLFANLLSCSQVSHSLFNFLYKQLPF
jgi:hypothetical protein